MPLSSADAALITEMKQRELLLKRRHRAADAIAFRVRRYRASIGFLVAAVFGLAVTGVVILVAGLTPGPTRWHIALPVIAVGVFIGVLIAERLLDTDRSRRMVTAYESRLRDRYSGDLHAGRRWQQFYYEGEDISAYVPQILYFLESERRFDSIRDALAAARSHRRESQTFAARAVEQFAQVAAKTNALVVASTGEDGRPSIRIMRFVKGEQPGVWYVTTAPEGPKVPEFDRGRIALVTVPTEAGATISSNRVQIERAGVAFSEVAGLYRDQVPGYLASMTDDDQQRDLIYRLRFQSARVDTWEDHVVVEFT